MSMNQGVLALVEISQTIEYDLIMYIVSPCFVLESEVLQKREKKRDDLMKQLK